MSALSMDLRARIVDAYQAGEGSYSSLEVRFAVSKAMVGKLVRQHRELGVFLPPYSPDLNPIENIFAKLKQLIRKIRPKTWKQIVKATKEALTKILAL